jgi:hypothetical protein
MERNWNKVGALGTLAGVLITSLIGVAGLVLMWWIYQHTISQISTDTSAPKISTMPITWWMPSLIVIAIIGAGVLHFSAVRMNRTKVPIFNPVKEQPDSHPLLSSPLFAPTQRAFEMLSISQRFLVKEIYEHPGTPVAFLGRTLDAMKFPLRVGTESLNKVLTTNLVRRTPVDAEPNTTVKNIVETLLESANLPSPEIVKQINIETGEAVKTDCNLGCKIALDDLRREHIKTIDSARADLRRVGACELLTDQAECLQRELNRIIEEDANDQFEKKLWPRPLDPEILNASKGTLWSWQHRAWSRWHASFWNHCFAVKNFGPKGLETDLTKATAVRDTVVKFDNVEMFRALKKHREALVAAQRQLLKPYEDSGEKVVSV